MKKEFSPGGKTRLIGIFGWPLSYTLSPRFQNAGLRALGLDAAYLPFPCEAEKFPGLARSLMRLPGFLGGNVTNPHKVAALKLADSLTPEARAIGAVNTLYRRGKKWIGHNTDAEGFSRSLKFPLKGAGALVLGAGGAAQAVVYALLKSGAGKVWVAARRLSQARGLQKRFGRRVASCALSREVIQARTMDCRLLVNTVPGDELARFAASCLSRQSALKVVAEISYVPLDTALLKTARKLGLRAQGGLGMLLEQGILAFERITGRKAPRKAMEKALGY